MKKILAIPGSIRAKSSNLSILKLIAGMIPKEMEYEIYTGLGSIPLFNPDLDHSTVDEAVNDFREKIKEADGVLICTPEYAFGVPGALKNALDWMVSSTAFSDKPIALITASSEGSKAHESLQHTLYAIGTKFSKEETLLISLIKSKINTEGMITDAATLQAVKVLVGNFLHSVTKIKKD